MSKFTFLLAVLLIAALDGITLLKQDLGNGAHTNAANPDDMESPYLTGHLHNRRSPGPILLRLIDEEQK